MKIRTDRWISGVMFILFLIIILAVNFQNRRNVNIVEDRLDTLSMQLQQMNVMTKSVVENLRGTLVMIDKLSDDLESSGKQLEGILKEGASMTYREKEKIRSALIKIDSAIAAVEAEKIKALKLIDELNPLENELQ